MIMRFTYVLVEETNLNNFNKAIENIVKGYGYHGFAVPDICMRVTSLTPYGDLMTREKPEKTVYSQMFKIEFGYSVDKK